MTDFYNTPTQPKAACDHKCTYCHGLLPRGEIHYKQTGNYDGDWFANRYHDECWQELNRTGEDEFMPGEGEIPDRINALMEQRATQKDSQS